VKNNFFFKAKEVVAKNYNSKRYITKRRKNKTTKRGDMNQNPQGIKKP